jgi:hypothetical protein
MVLRPSRVPREASDLTMLLEDEDDPFTPTEPDAWSAPLARQGWETNARDARC